MNTTEQRLLVPIEATQGTYVRPASVQTDRSTWKFVYDLPIEIRRRIIIKLDSTTSDKNSVQHPFSLARYMQQIKTWAEAYDQETINIKEDELKSLYDNDFFEAMDL